MIKVGVNLATHAELKYSSKTDSQQMAYIYIYIYIYIGGIEINPTECNSKNMITKTFKKSFYSYLNYFPLSRVLVFTFKHHQTN